MSNPKLPIAEERAEAQRILDERKRREAERKRKLLSEHWPG